jgi:hypothetical protein
MTKAQQEARRFRAAELWEERDGAGEWKYTGSEIARLLQMSDMALYMMIKHMRQNGMPLTNRKPGLSARFARIRELEHAA